MPQIVMRTNAGDHRGLARIYLKAGTLTSALVLPSAIIIASHPFAVVYAWTGSSEAANWSHEILPPYILGGAAMALSAYSYSLQVAAGRVSAHLVYSVVLCIVTVCGVVIGVELGGVLAVALVWLVGRSFGALIWTPYIQSRFVPGINASWVVRCLALPGIIGLLASAAAAALLHGTPSRLMAAAVLCATVAIATTCTLAAQGRFLLGVEEGRLYE